jgi:hypothetical protein
VMVSSIVTILIQALALPSVIANDLFPPVVFEFR